VIRTQLGAVGVGAVRHDFRLDLHLRVVEDELRNHRRDRVVNQVDRGLALRSSASPCFVLRVEAPDVLGEELVTGAAHRLHLLEPVVHRPREALTRREILIELMRVVHFSLTPPDHRRYSVASDPGSLPVSIWEVDVVQLGGKKAQLDVVEGPNPTAFQAISAAA
jgi:hypothetical protein